MASTQHPLPTTTRPPSTERTSCVRIPWTQLFIDVSFKQLLLICSSDTVLFYSRINCLYIWLAFFVWSLQPAEVLQRAVQEMKLGRLLPRWVVVGCSYFFFSSLCWATNCLNLLSRDEKIACSSESCIGLTSCLLDALRMLLSLLSLSTTTTSSSSKWSLLL